MEYMSIVLELILALTLVLGLRSLAVIKSNKDKKFPPGPTPLPIIGNLHLLGDKPHKSLALLAKTHGPIMSLKFGLMINTVVFSSADMAKQALQKHDLAFSNRFVVDAIHALDHYQFSSIFLPPKSCWRTLRKIMNSHIFSASKLDANQHLRSSKVQELIEYCHKCGQIGEPVDVGRAAFTTSLNLLSNTIFSKDLSDLSSDSATEFKKLVGAMAVEAGKPNMVDYFPFLKKLDPQGIRRRLTGNFTKVLDILRCLIDERVRQRKLVGYSEDGDVLDALLNINRDSPGEIDMNLIEHMCLDLFAAGTDTTTNTLEWAVAELLKNPHTMERAQAELSQVIGKGKLVNEADIARLPYLGCIIKETLRIHPPLPLLVPRKAEEDVEVCGYVVSKGSQLLVNVWAIGRDSELWENPLVFMPERFLESNIDVRGRDFELVPFGGGRRICPGINLAARMIPVVLGSLLNSFTWKLQAGISAKDLDMEERFGFSLAKAEPLLAIPIPV